MNGISPPCLQEFCVLVEKVQGRPQLWAALTYQEWRHRRPSTGPQRGRVCHQHCEHISASAQITRRDGDSLHCGFSPRHCSCSWHHEGDSLCPWHCRYACIADE